MNIYNQKLRALKIHSKSMKFQILAKDKLVKYLDKLSDEFSIEFVFYIASICFEFSIKILWEIENKAKSCFTHNIWELWNDLRCKDKVEEIWSNWLEELDEFIENDRKKIDREEFPGQGHLKHILEVFEECDIERDFGEVLKENENIIKNYKYSFEPGKKAILLIHFIWSQSKSDPELQYSQYSQLIFYPLKDSSFIFKLIDYVEHVEQTCRFEAFGGIDGLKSMSDGLPQFAED